MIDIHRGPVTVDELGIRAAHVEIRHAIALEVTLGVRIAEQVLVVVHPGGGHAKRKVS